MGRLLGWLALVLVSSSTVAAAPTAPKPKAPRYVGLSTVTTRPPLAADTLVLAAGWTNPVNDGKGPLDSLRVRIVGWSPEPQMTWRTAGWTFPTSYTFRVPIDYGAQSGGTGTFELRACVGVWRFRMYAETCSAIVPFTLTYPLPPTPSGVNLNVTRVPPT